MLVTDLFIENTKGKNSVIKDADVKGWAKHLSVETLANMMSIVLHKPTEKNEGGWLDNLATVWTNTDKNTGWSCLFKSLAFTELLSKQLYTEFYNPGWCNEITIRLNFWIIFRPRDSPKKRVYKYLLRLE